MEFSFVLGNNNNNNTHINNNRCRLDLFIKPLGETDAIRRDICFLAKRNHNANGATHKVPIDSNYAGF